MIYTLLGLNVLVIIVGIKYFFHQQKKHRLIVEQALALEKNLEQINKDYPILINADLLFAKQLAEINKQLVSMDNQIQNLENKRDNDGGYQHALRILEMGGSREEIMDSCHLSNAEAELLMNLQAYRTAIKVT